MFYGPKQRSTAAQYVIYARECYHAPAWSLVHHRSSVGALGTVPPSRDNSPISHVKRLTVSPSARNLGPFQVIVIRLMSTVALKLNLRFRTRLYVMRNRPRACYLRWI